MARPIPILMTNASYINIVKPLLDQDTSCLFRYLLALKVVEKKQCFEKKDFLFLPSEQEEPLFYQASSDLLEKEKHRVQKEANSDLLNSFSTCFIEKPNTDRSLESLELAVEEKIKKHMDQEKTIPNPTMVKSVLTLINQMLKEDPYWRISPSLSGFLKDGMRGEKEVYQRFSKNSLDKETQMAYLSLHPNFVTALDLNSQKELSFALTQSLDHFATTFGIFPEYDLTTLQESSAYCKKLITKAYH